MVGSTMRYRSLHSWWSVWWTTVFFLPEESALTQRFSHSGDRPLLVLQKRVCAFLNTRPIWIRVSFSSVSLGWLTRQLKTAWMDPASRYQVVSVGHTQPKHGALTRPRFPVTIDTACVNFTHGQEYNYLDNSIAIDGHWNETFRGESTSRGLFIRSKCSVTTFDFTANTSAAATLMLAPPTARLDF